MLSRCNDLNPHPHLLCPSPSTGYFLSPSPIRILVSFTVAYNSPSILQSIMSLIEVKPILPSNLTSTPLQPGNRTSDTIKANLRIHSRYIRDTLAPALSRTGGTLTDVQLATLKSIFASISAVPMTMEYLQYSRIEKALAVIASGGGAWPADASLMAEALLTSWEDRIGPLKNVRADLWGKGSRLEGCKKLVDWDEERMVPQVRYSPTGTTNGLG